MDGPGIPGWFVALAVLMALGGIATMVVRISMARDLARRAGLDPDQAAATTLLTTNGLDATYLAASLRSASGAGSPTATAPTAKARLEELNALHDQGLITPAEYAERRKAILDAI